MIKTLRTLVRACDGDQRPDCPIMEELGAGQTPIGRHASTRLRRANNRRGAETSALA
jgi:hypothetical protein